MTALATLVSVLFIAAVFLAGVALGVAAERSRWIR